MERLTYKGPELPFTDDDGDVVEAYSDRGVREIINRLAAYEDTGLEPEEIERILDAYGRGHTLRTESAERLEIMREVKTDRLREIIRAEKDGRLVVLPCGTDVNLIRDGHSYKADHWNHTLTAFRDAPENKSGKQVALFSIEEAEAALKGDPEQ